MGRPNEIAELIKQRMSPSGIAKHLGISPDSVRQYLFRAFGEGLIRRSDILFSIDRDLRKQIEDVIAAVGEESITVQFELRRLGLRCDEDVSIYLQLREDRVSAGDLYEFVCELERTLHDLIRVSLQQEFGPDESGWWRQGVPLTVRTECVSARERDEQFSAEPYGYTTLIHLKDIIDRNWKLFSSRLPAEVAANKAQFLSSITRLNSIRNRVMHPVRSAAPTEDDFAFVRGLHRQLERDRWRDISNGP